MQIHSSNVFSHFLIKMHLCFSKAIKTPSSVFSCPRPSLASCLSVLLSCPLCGRVPLSRITELWKLGGRSSSESSAVAKASARAASGRPVFLGPTFPASPSAPVVGLWVWRQTVTFPAHRQRHPGPLPHFTPGSQSSSVPGLSALAKCQSLRM